MPAQPQKIDLNLLPTEDLEKTPAGRFLKWALTIGRYIVIFTELVVLVAFGSRFWLDRTLSDLRESIKQKQAIIESVKDLETEARSVQGRLQKIGELINSSLKADEILVFLGQITPTDIIYDSLNIDTNRTVISATTFSEASLALFVTNLKNSDRFTDINLESVEKNKRQQGEIVFTLSAKYK
mgnify:CR=1 FL=1